MLVKIEDIKTIKGKRLADKYKLEERRVYFESTGHFPRPVLLDSNNHIIDGYTSYAVAKERNLQKLSVPMTCQFMAITGIKGPGQNLTVPIAGN
jgi:hypothetical protein